MTKHYCWLGALSAFTVMAVAAPLATYQLSFDNDNRLPANWMVDATGGRPADWQVTRDPKAVSRPHVLAIAKINDASPRNFNLLWSPNVRFRDGSIEVSIRADGGNIDQGGGLIWRARDSNNYYIARYNPLERNLRFYVVQDGARRLLADASNLGVGRGEWFVLKVVHHGKSIQSSLNGKTLIETTDATFADAGGIGFWAKADAASVFDNLTVRYAPGGSVAEE